MTNRISIIDFKTVSPLYEMERDGIKPFTERLVDTKDTRFRVIARWWRWLPRGKPLVIKITNPATGESFTRELIGKRYMQDHTFGMSLNYLKPAWIILYLGKK